MYNDITTVYQISNKGNIRHKVKLNIRKTSINKGYEYCDIYVLQKPTKIGVHRLVATAFVPNPLNLPEVNHKNHNRLDNRVENLEWTTSQNNSIHSRTNLNRQTCKKVIIRYEDVEKTKIMKRYESINDAAKDIGIAISTISALLRGVKKSKQYFFKYEQTKIQYNTQDLLDNNFEPVKNHPQYLIHKDSRIFSIRRKIFLKPYTSHDNYFSVSLNKNSYNVHRLIAIQFLPNPDNKPLVNHKDGNKFNNHVDNLEWATNSENVNHAIDTGLNPINKPVNQYTLDGEYITTYKSLTDACRVLKLTKNGSCVISQCCKGVYKSAHGFIWKFADDDTPVVPVEIKKIKQYSLNGIFIKEFDSPTSALSSIGKRLDLTSQILNCCKGITKFAFDYIWKFSSDNNKVLPVIKPRRQNIEVEQFDLNGKYIATYSSYVTAALSLGKNKHAGNLIGKCANGQVDTAYNFKWKIKV